MDQGFELFLNWQTAILCLGIYLLTYSVRKTIEVLWQGSAKNRIYSELLLPLGPIGNGVIIAIVAKQFPWPEPITHSTSARIMYGAIAGLASGWFYNRFRAFLKSKGFSTSVSPPPGPGTSVFPPMPKQDPLPKAPVESEEDKDIPPTVP